MAAILLVDDHEQSLEVTRLTLQQCGHLVITAINGRDALEKLEQGSVPEVVITDVVMPVMDGYALCRALKQDERWMSIPVIFISSTFVDSRDQDFGLKIGAEGFVVKTLESTEFLATINGIIERTSHQKTGRPFSVLNDQFIAGYVNALNRTLHGKVVQLEETNRKLHESEARLKETQQMANLGYWEWKVDSGEVEWSEEVYSIFGRDPGEFHPRIDSILSLSPWPEESQRGRELIEKATKSKQPGKFEQRFLYPDGTVGHYASTFQGVYDEGGALTAIKGTVQDITERKRAEESLKKSSIIINTTTDAILTTDLHGRITFWNRGAEMLYGHRQDEVLGKSVSIIYPDDENGMKTVLDQVIGGTNIPTVEVEHICKNKRRLNVLLSLTAIRGEDGNVVEILGISKDISERKKAEKALKASELRYRNIVETASEGIWLTDETFHIIFVNPRMAEMLGYTTDEMVGRSTESFIFEEDLADHREKMKLRGNGTSDKYERRLRSRDGSELYTIASTTDIVDEQGEFAGVIKMFTDITERKAAEEEKERIQTQLHHAQRMESIGTLAGGIAHDFNNILTSILGFTELALGNIKEDASIFDDLQEVKKAGTRAKELVNQILSVARQSKKEMQPIQVNLIAKEVLKLIRSSVPSTIDINNQIRSDSLILGNATQIHQVIMNLCTNAAQAMEDTGGTMEVRMLDVDLDQNHPEVQNGLATGRYIELMVSDTGSGIRPDVIESIFNPYFTTKARSDGTGMGLAIVQGIVESYGGRIGVESQPGRGSVFTVYLPVFKRQTVERRETRKELPKGTEHILCVDDEEAILKMNSRLLGRQGYSVTVKKGSLEALDEFRSQPHAYDLVLTDMTMPKMTGDDLAVEVRKIRSDIPIILCTGYSTKITDKKAMEIGINAFIFKPIDNVDLVRTIRRVLDKNYRR